MTSETNTFEAALMHFRKAYRGRQHELAVLLGVSRSTVSVLLTSGKTTARNAKALVDIWKRETALISDAKLQESTPPYRVDEPEKPQGFIEFEGMRVPFYGTGDRTQLAIDAAARLRIAVGATPPPTVDALKASRTVSGVSGAVPTPPRVPAGSQSAAPGRFESGTDPVNPAHPAGETDTGSQAHADALALAPAPAPTASPAAR